jgi:hypothetical protein
MISPANGTSTVGRRHHGRPDREARDATCRVAAAADVVHARGTDGGTERGVVVGQDQHVLVARLIERIRDARGLQVARHERQVRLAILKPELARPGGVDDLRGDVVTSQADAAQLLERNADHGLLEEHLARVVQGQTVEPGDDAEAVARELLDGIAVHRIGDDAVDVADLHPVRQERELDILAEGRLGLERRPIGDQELHVEHERLGDCFATAHLVDLHRAAVEARRRESCGDLRLDRGHEGEILRLHTLVTHPVGRT